MSAPRHASFAIDLDGRQAGLVRQALAARPYREVHALIGRLDGWQAGSPFVLDGAELLLVVQALADLPYRRVHGLVGSLCRQLAALTGAAREPA